MRKTILFFTILAVLSLCGCAKKQWYKDGVTLSEMQRDFRECQYDAKKYSFVPFQGYGDIGVGIVSGLQQSMREMQIMEECMKSKGYRLVPVEE